MFTGMLFGIVSTALAVEWPGSISFNLYLCLQFLEAELNKALLLEIRVVSQCLPMGVVAQEQYPEDLIKSLL